VRKTPLFPMTANEFVVVLTLFATIILFLYFFFVSTRPEYSYDRTVKVEVVNVFKSSGSERKSSKKLNLQIRYEDGMSQIVSIPMTRSVKKGELIDLSIYQADGEKPRYQLAQDPVEP